MEFLCLTEEYNDWKKLVLQIPIERVEVSKEKSVIYHPEYKGVRLDVYAMDECLGIVESVLCLLEELGIVSEELREKIQNETELQILQRWLKLAAKSESLEQFQKDM